MNPALHTPSLDLLVSCAACASTTRAGARVWFVARSNSVASALAEESDRVHDGCCCLGGERGRRDVGAAPSSWPPAVADRYKQAVVVGKGMFGKVYAAWDSVDEQLVAVKQLSGRTDDEFVVTGPSEFAQEVMALEVCRGHPNVVKLVATFADDPSGNRFIITEFAGKMNLRRYIWQRFNEGRAFKEDEVRRVMAQLLSGVACAHDAGVLHREVVPENVIVDVEDDNDDDDLWQQIEKKKKACKYTICGFNASQQAGQTARDGSAKVVSSSQYRAPELFLASSTVYDERIDTWGLGCIMANLLAGTGVPFFRSGSDDAQSLKGVLQVVGGKGLVEWPGLQRAATPQEASELREQYCRETGRLRAEFPKKKLSRAGFDVLSGLLQSNPDRRLTALWPRSRCHGSVVAA